MKILVTGVGGQLGYDVMKVLKARYIDCLGADRKEFDITDYAAAHKFIMAYHPDAVIHCSAYTAVDKAESEPELAARINAFAVSEDLPAHGECVLSRFVKDPYDKATLREQEKEAGLR